MRLALIAVLAPSGFTAAWTGHIRIAFPLLAMCALLLFMMSRELNREVTDSE